MNDFCNCFRIIIRLVVNYQLQILLRKKVFFFFVCVLFTHYLLILFYSMYENIQRVLCVLLFIFIQERTHTKYFYFISENGTNRLISLKIWTVLHPYFSVLCSVTSSPPPWKNDIISYQNTLCKYQVIGKNYEYLYRTI